MPTPPDDARWYRQRSYAHFDRRPSRDAVLTYVRDPAKVTKHGFFPLIMRPVRVCHFVDAGQGRRRHEYKVRPVTYAAHMDTHIHAFYASCLGDRLEELLKAPFGASVLAYRRLSPPQNNVDFAVAAFREVIARGEADVLAIDIEGFFDGLNHAILKQAWAAVLGQDRLEADQFAVFKSVTRDYAVEWGPLRKALKDRHRRRAGATGEPVCSIKEFRALIAPLVEPRHALVWKVKGKDPPACIPKGVPVGIPQGSAISAVLANVYMLAVDRALHQQLSAVGASYRRYSDDILIIGPPGTLAACEAAVVAALGTVSLSVNAKKTERVEFRMNGDRRTSTFVTADGAWQLGRPMQYLGLAFDGERARLRDGTMSRYFIRMNRAVKRAGVAARANGEPMHLRKVYAGMSHLGRGRAYGPWKFVAGKLTYPPHAPRPGFLAYSTRADSKSADLSLIDAQNRRAWEELHVALKAEKSRPGK